MSARMRAGTHHVEDGCAFRANICILWKARVGRRAFFPRAIRSRRTWRGHVM